MTWLFRNGYNYEVRMAGYCEDCKGYEVDIRRRGPPSSGTRIHGGVHRDVLEDLEVGEIRVRWSCEKQERENEQVMNKVQVLLRLAVNCCWRCPRWWMRRAWAG